MVMLSTRTIEATRTGAATATSSYTVTPTYLQMVSQGVAQHLGAKTKTILDKLYARYDLDFPTEVEVARRYRAVMDEIDESFGQFLKGSAFSREMHFWTLFMYSYEYMFGRKKFDVRPTAKALTDRKKRQIQAIGRRIQAGDVPAGFDKAASGAATDLDKRKTRYNYVVELLG